MDDQQVEVEKQIVSYIRTNCSSGICFKEELLSMISPKSNLDYTIAGSSQVIEWGERQLILTEKLVMRPTDKKILFAYLKKECEYGGHTFDSLFNKMKVDRRLFSILKGKKVDDSEKLASFLTWHFPEINI
ncbi:hypothetical protein [Domibacillus iocasae]|uniref:Uncharacterized protein n=1 Tax=Domibacillus iocasae TaxID=1714016 RepID=A0A1E7DRY1_9BACI|nr:hypothetical protein [Domibacillus iocasae]OES45765.1 hypothetical protein BA724_02870 [Domibacillus iocasae]